MFKGILLAGAIILGIGVAGVAIKAIMFPVTVANIAMNSATGVVSRTLDSNNVITRYEWFHDANGRYKSRINQIHQSTSDYTTASPTDKSSIRVDLNAQKQSCRDIVTQYNANSEKTNQSIFKGREAPISLEIQPCEG